MNEQPISKSVIMRSSEDQLSEEESYFEDRENWRKIIFLPYKMLWRIMIVCTILLDCLIVTYSCSFSNHVWNTALGMYYICECVYFVDFVLVISHRYMIPYQKTQTYLPKNSYFLLIDALTLLPYYETYYILQLSSKGKAHKFSWDYTRLKVFLRISNIVQFFYTTDKIPGLNHILVTTLTQMVIFFLYQIIVAAFLYSLRNYSTLKWTDNLQYHNFNNRSALQWLILTNTLIGNVLAHNWSAIIKPENAMEMIIFSVTMILGFLIHIMIFFGQLTALYIKRIADQFIFSARLEVIAQMLDDWKIDKKIKFDVMDKYNAFWEKMYGEKNMPSHFYTLPKSLQRHCTIDIFWHCFKHSQLFTEMELPFLTNLSLWMKNEFYMPGEYIYHYNDVKTKMIYIISGVVEVVGQDARASSIISFSGGTVLGEISCLMLVRSKVHLRCATYCKLQTLEIQSLLKMTRKYRKSNKYLQNRLKLRFTLARELQHAELVKVRNRMEKRTSVKWLKQQWRSIHHEQKGKTKTQLEERYQQITVYHTSRFLGLYVLSEEVELKKKIICLKSTCPYLLEPSSSFKLFCDYLILVTILVQTIFLPYMCFFHQEFTKAEIGWFYMLDLLYVFGIYLDLSTVIEDNKKVISSLNLILIYKGKQVSTLVDIFSTLPIELLSGLLSASPRTEAILRLNRVLRVYKIFKVIGQRQLNVWVNYLRIRLIKYALLFSYVLYFLSCLVFGMSCYQHCDSCGWLAYNTLVRELVLPEHFNSTDRPLPLLVSLDYTASRLLSLTYGYRYAYSMPDIIIEHLMVLLGYYMFSFCFAELAACAVLQLDVQSRYQKFLQGLSAFANRQKLPSELKKHMYNLIHCQWHYNKRYEITGPDSIMKDMPENLRNDILLARIVHCLKTLALFVEAEESFLWAVARVADLAVYPEGTVIMREDIRQVHMYVILRGHCAVESSIPTDKYHQYVMTYSFGDSFPVLEVFHKVNSFLKVTAITTVEIVTIPLSKLMTCIKGDERLHEDLKAVIASHMETYYMVLTRQKGRLPEMHSDRKARGRGEYFEYSINDKVLVDSHKLISAKTFDSLGHWSFLRYFLLRNTFEPTGKFFTTWELIRSVVSVTQVMYVLFFMKFHLKRKIFRGVVRFLLDAVLIVDIYIRMHVRYYDQRGIQITHPWYTLHHYVKTSFFLDVFLIMPYHELQLHTMFGKEKRHHVLMLFNTLLKPFLLHRSFNGLNYLQETSKQGKAMLYHNIRYVGLVLVVFGMFSNVLEILTCWEASDSPYIFYECPNNTWIRTSILKTDIRESYYTASIISLYAILSIFATCTVGLFKFETSKELTVIFFITAGLFALRWFVLAKITSSRISGNRTLVHYQHNMKIFLAFMKKYCHKVRLVQEIVSHYEYSWKKTKGYPTTRAIGSFNLVMKRDLTYFLYANAVSASYLLYGADASFIRYISNSFEEVQFRKDAEIIRCNDINAYIYLVYKGEVDVTVANDKLCTLTVGGMFGCFSPTGNTRQTITARAKFNVDVLRIRNVTFNEIVLMNQKVKQKITKERFLRSEYILPVSNVKAAHSDAITYESVEVNTEEGHSFKAFLISPTNPYYQIYDYVINVHLATLSSLLITTVIVGVNKNKSWKYNAPIYTLDVIFLTKLILGFHVTYMDPYSGLYVTQFSVIWRRYAKSVTGFWLDIGTLLPFELLAMPFVIEEQYLKYFLLNKTLRFIFLIKYYTNCKNTLTVSRHLRWTYLMYIMVLLIHLNTCVWWLIACPERKCSYFARVSHEPYTLVTAEDTFSSFRIAYLYVINVFSSTGLKMVTPTSSAELTATIIMVCVAQYILVALTAGFASMLVQDKSVMTQFEREAGHVLKYLEATNLSLSLKNKVWNYYIMLWTRAQGPWLPELISNAPSYLKEDIMKQLYGQFLQQHFLFKKTHVDFLRQLVAQLELCVFLPGMYITTKGSIDNSMYFIEEGEVIVYELNGRTEVELLILGAGKSFGEVQGLYSLPHDKTYKARFTTRILILHKKNWYHLLQWFPASKEQIEEQAARRLRMQTIRAYYG